jgi:hypothetical protein
MRVVWVVHVEIRHTAEKECRKKEIPMDIRLYGARERQVELTYRSC